MIPKLKCSDGSIITTGTIVRVPFGKPGEERNVYATFMGVHGNSKVRKVGLALTGCNSRGTKAVNILNILDADKVTLGSSTIFYSKGVPMRQASEQEVAVYKQKVAEAIKAKQK